MERERNMGKNHILHRRRVSNLGTPVYKARPLSVPPFYPSLYIVL